MIVNKFKELDRELNSYNALGVDHKQHIQKIDSLFQNMLGTIFLDNRDDRISAAKKLDRLRAIADQECAGKIQKNHPYFGFIQNVFANLLGIQSCPQTYLELTRKVAKDLLLKLRPQGSFLFSQEQVVVSNNIEIPTTRIGKKKFTIPVLLKTGHEDVEMRSLQEIKDYFHSIRKNLTQKECGFLVHLLQKKPGCVCGSSTGIDLVEEKATQIIDVTDYAKERLIRIQVLRTYRISIGDIELGTQEISQSYICRKNPDFTLEEAEDIYSPFRLLESRPLPAQEKKKEVKKNELSYFEITKKIMEILQVVAPDALPKDLAMQVANNVLLPICTSIVTSQVRELYRSGEEDSSVAIGVMSASIQILSEQMRIYKNRNFGKTVAESIKKYLIKELLGEASSDQAAIKLKDSIKELEKAALAKGFEYADTIGDRAGAFLGGTIGNFSEILSTSASLYVNSQSVSVPCVILGTILAAAASIKSSTQVADKAKYAVQQNKKGQENTIKYSEASANVSTFRGVCAKLETGSHRQGQLDERESFWQGEAVVVRDVISEFARYALKIIQDFILGNSATGLDKGVIDICSIQGMSLMGSVRRLFGTMSEDITKLVKALTGVSELLLGIKKFRQFVEYREAHFHRSFSQEMGNHAIRIQDFDLGVHGSEINAFLDSHKTEDFMGAYAALMQKSDLVKINGCNLSLEKGKVYKLEGSSNCGKSSFLRALEGYWPMAAGQVSFFCSPEETCFLYGGNIDVVEECTYENLALYPRFFSQSPGDGGIDPKSEEGQCLRRRLTYILNELEIPNVSESNAKGMWNTLSGGQKNRMIIARMLMQQTLPKILVLDEVISNVDKNVQNKIFNLLRKELGSDATVLYIRHGEKDALDEANYDNVIHFTSELRLLSREEYVGSLGKKMNS